MNKRAWRTLLKSIEIDPSGGEVTPVEPSTIDDFEERWGGKLPKSYRTYCEVFGAGTFGDSFNIAIPGYRGKAATFSLDRLNKSARNRDHAEYANDVEQYDRGIYFCWDLITSIYFFDPDDVVGDVKHEYAVYLVYRDWEVVRVADNFWEFVTEVCIGEKKRQVIKGTSPKRVFNPVSY